MVLGCLLPIVGAQVFTQVNLSAQRKEQLSRLALRQAELANSDIRGIIDGMRQLATVAAQFPKVQAGGAACNDRLDRLLGQLESFRFIAVLGPDGALRCASGLALPGQPADTAWLAPLLSATTAGVGAVTIVPGIDGPLLPVVVPLAGASHGAVVAALDLAWLDRHLAEARPAQAGSGTNGGLLLLDRNGAVIGQHPGGQYRPGERVPDSLRRFIDAPAAGVTVLPHASGDDQLIAYVPATVPPENIATVEVLSLGSMTGDLRAAGRWDLAIIVAATLLALILAMIAGRRFIYRPTEALLQASRRWQNGDLGARAHATDAGTEFGALASSFNAMAEALQAREAELEGQGHLLEVRVAERTRELSESNNRLQVEIAEREKTEALLHQAQKLQAVGKLAGGIAHDFNNMLATILGNLELMERRIPQVARPWGEADAQKLMALIERATGAVQRGSRLTAQLLAFSRRQKLTARPTDLTEVISELISLATSTLGRRVRVTSNFAADVWPAMVDPSQAEAAILNLCLNARDAMPDGGELTVDVSNLTVTETVRPAEVPAGDYVRVVIADTGTGMTADVRQRAFDPFFTTKGPAGSGLGLSQVYGMARQSGGAVWIESQPGDGTRVTLLLPRARPEAVAEADAPEAAAPRPARRVPGEVVLVVDDDHAVRQVTVEMLRDLGFETVQFAGGAEALGALEGQQPDYILLDYAMPGMNGLQLARRLRERDITAPIALVTGYAEFTDRDALANPLDGLLRKPFTIRELRGLLANLRTRRPGRPARAEAAATARA
jgi:signal transduction histidine kinase/ActR/RegA family two-component response regulator